MKGGAAAIVILILVVAAGTAGAYFYASQPRGGETVTVPAQEAAFTVDVDAAADAIYVDNYGAVTSMAVFVDGEEVSVSGDLSGDTGVLLFDEPLTAGEHTIVVQAGDQYVEKRIVVDEKWTIDFDISASAA